MKVKEICPGTTQQWIQDGAILVDVREKDEVERLAFDAPDVLTIPLSEFESRFNEIPKNKNVVIACRVGERSLRAANYLIHNGYDKEHVVNMKFGLNRWVSKGYSTVGDPKFILNDDMDNSCCSS